MQLKVTTWYLEAFKEKHKAIDENLLVELLVINPTTTEYKELYSKTGSDLCWVDRMMMDDSTLSSQIHDQNIQIFLFLYKHHTIGYGEVYFEDSANAEIKYFGLFPEGRGKGLGSCCLQLLMETCFQYGVERIWLHTCELDHPSALNTYTKNGFEVFDRAIIIQHVPENWKKNIRGTALQYPKEEMATDRITLKKFNSDQYIEFLNLIRNNYDRLKDYFPKTIDGVKDDDSTKEFLDQRNNDWHIGSTFSYAMYSKENNQLLGTLTIKSIDYKLLKAYVGYYLDKLHEGKGYMKEAVMLLINEARSINLKTLTLRIEPKNLRSKSLALACGFTFDKKIEKDFHTLDGEVLDLEYYVLKL